MHRFKKIKWDQKEITLLWTTETPSETHEHELTSKQEPHKDLDEALQALVGDVLNVCEIDAPTEDVRVQSVSLSFSEKSGLRGAVVTALKSVQIANSPVVLNTPHLAEDGENDKGVMPSRMWARIQALEVQAAAYLNGKRAPKAQLDAFDADSEADAAAGLTTISVNGGPAVPLGVVRQALDIVTGRDRAAGRD